jgi:hypothetical protein
MTRRFAPTDFMFSSRPHKVVAAAGSEAFAAPENR